MRAVPLILGLVLGAGLAFYVYIHNHDTPLSCFVGKRVFRERYVGKTLSPGSLACVVLGKRPRYTEAARLTWGRSCDRLLLANDAAADRRSLHGSSNGAKSSFHVLCDVIRKIGSRYPQIEWVIFAKDDMFVVPENVRYLVSGLNSSEPHYLGHAINFWGVDYNVASAGIILSRETIRRFNQRFTTTEDCIAGGKYWKQEDLYLGKHLAALGIRPADTRDEYDNNVFFAYDLDKILFSTSLRRLTNFYTRAVYPVKCCGTRTIAFQVLSYTDVYRYYYMTYTLKVYPYMSKNIPSLSSPSEDFIWGSLPTERHTTKHNFTPSNTTNSHNNPQRESLIYNSTNKIYDRP